MRDFMLDEPNFEQAASVKLRIDPVENFDQYEGGREKNYRE